MTNRYKLLIEYDGTHFSGWQKQPFERTVEGEIEKALSTLYQIKIDIIGQGRTDAGVHAIEQVAHVDLPAHLSEQRVIHAMRGLLPNDVTIYGIEKCRDDFHARFDAISRSYSYKLSNRPVPLDRHKIWYSYLYPDETLLIEMSDRILGKHDFLQFCTPNNDPDLTTICTVSESKWERKGGLWIYTITGNRFLRHMVRRLVGTMVQVASGKTRFDIFQKMLKYPEGNFAAFTAPPNGLTLKSVKYPDDK